MKNKTKTKTRKEQEEIVDRYTTTGVQGSSMKSMCREAKISYPKLVEFLQGQTMGMVGKEPMIYPWDIKRFIAILHYEKK